MKKIIGGKIYDTATAKRCGAWDNGHYTNDFQYCAETLYLKKTNEFFLHGEGHALSKYAGHSGNSSGWGEQITPLTYDQASEWAQEHLDANEYIAIFGDPEENADRTTICVSVRKDTSYKLKQLAAKSGKTVSEYIEDMINA